MGKRDRAKYWQVARDNRSLWVLILSAAAATILTQIKWLPDSALLYLLIPVCWQLVTWALWQQKIASTLEVIQGDLARITGGVVESLGDRHALYVHLENQVHIASSWKILTFSPYRKDAGDGATQKEKYQEAMERRIKNGTLQVQRACAVWNQEHIEHLVKRMRRYEGFHYHVSCMLPPALPTLNMILIDDKEVVFWLFQKRKYLKGDPGSFRITHKPIVAMCTAYYSEVWATGDDILKLIKDDYINEPAVNDMRKALAAEAI